MQKCFCIFSVYVIFFQASAGFGGKHRDPLCGFHREGIGVYIHFRGYFVYTFYDNFLIYNGKIYFLDVPYI